MKGCAQDIERIRQAYVSTDKARCAERLRHHIWSPRRPWGRIHRLYACVVCKKECQTEAHHPDYERPFYVSWLCTSCHRSVEQGGIKLQPRHLFNYSSLVRTQRFRWRKGSRGPAFGGRRKEKVPF
jgi:hypothetical protein